MGISEEDAARANIERFRHHPPQVLKQFHVLYLSGFMPVRQIALLLDMSERAVYDIRRRYHAQGFGHFLNTPRHRPSSSLEPFREQVKESFRNAPCPSTSEAIARIKDLTGVCLGLTQTRKFMKSMGLRYRMIGHVPGKADTARQQDFIDNELLPELEACRKHERHVFFMDAAHFVLAPFLAALWSFTRLFVKAPAGRQRFNVLGALHATTRQMETLTNTTYINSACIVELLKQLKQKYTGAPITVFLDNARYQRCSFVTTQAQALGIELKFLPPYSPNLNLIERVWKIVKKKALNGKYYEDHRRFNKAIEEAIEDFQKSDHSATLSHKFQTFKNMQIMAA